MNWRWVVLDIFRLPPDFSVNDRLNNSSVSLGGTGEARKIPCRQIAEYHIKQFLGKLFEICHNLIPATATECTRLGGNDVM